MWGEQTLEAKIEAARTKRFNEIVMKQGMSALRSVLSHKWAWPFKEPVDAEKLGLKDYHTIITHPMDLGTIKTRLEAGYYHHPDNLAADIRLVFTNARTFNPPASDVHIMAATLAEAFEGKWAASVQPKIAEAAAAIEVEAKKAGQRAAENERQRIVESAENKCREMERHLEARHHSLVNHLSPLAFAHCVVSRLDVSSLSGGKGNRHQRLGSHKPPCPRIRFRIRILSTTEGGVAPHRHWPGALAPVPAADAAGEARAGRRPAQARPGRRARGGAGRRRAGWD